MKVLLYTEGLKVVGKSGLGKAIKHQQKALDYAGVLYTTDVNSNYDILHINTYFLKSYFMVKKAKKMGKKIVYHAHSTEEDYKNGFIFSKLTSKLFKKWLIRCYSMGDVIITPTEYSKKILHGYKGLENKKIYSVSNGIELETFKKENKKSNYLRKRYNIKENEKVVFAIGLYIERKGIVDFVNLAKRMPEYKFVWFGYSPLSAATRPVKKAVNTKLNNLIFAGYVDSYDIKEAMNEFDLFIFPTLEETEGIPIIEALACNCNAIVRNIPVFDGWLIDKVNCYKAKDINEFEDKIKKILSGKLPSLTKEGYKVAKERDLKIIGEKLKKIYEEVIN